MDDTNISEHIENRRRINDVQMAVIDFKHDMHNKLSSDRAHIKDGLSADVLKHILKLELRIVELEGQCLTDKLMAPKPTDTALALSKVQQNIREYGENLDANVRAMISDMQGFLESLDDLRSNGQQLLNICAGNANKN